MIADVIDVYPLVEHFGHPPYLGWLDGVLVSDRVMYQPIDEILLQSLIKNCMVQFKITGQVRNHLCSSWIVWELYASPEVDGFGS